MIKIIGGKCWRNLSAPYNCGFVKDPLINNGSGLIKKDKLTLQTK